MELDDLMPTVCPDLACFYHEKKRGNCRRTDYQHCSIFARWLWLRLTRNIDFQNKVLELIDRSLLFEFNKQVSKRREKK